MQTYAFFFDLWVSFAEKFMAHDVMKCLLSEFGKQFSKEQRKDCYQTMPQCFFLLTAKTCFRTTAKSMINITIE